jgi:membrane protein implicated in regulation of membrane protease activity
MDSIDFWHWLILGVVLVVLEVFAPGAFFLWMGVAAFIVGLILWDMGWETQLLLFAIISVVSIALWRIRLHKHPTESEEPSLNARTQEYVGRVFTLTEAIENGYGKIHVDDAYWTVAGPDSAAGTKVKVISAAGLTLNVEPVAKN